MAVGGRRQATTRLDCQGRQRDDQRYRTSRSAALRRLRWRWWSALSLVRPLRRSLWRWRPAAEGAAARSQSSSPWRHLRGSISPDLQLLHPSHSWRCRRTGASWSLSWPMRRASSISGCAHSTIRSPADFRVQTAPPIPSGRRMAGASASFLLECSSRSAPTENRRKRSDVRKLLPRKSFRVFVFSWLLFVPSWHLPRFLRNRHASGGSSRRSEWSKPCAATGSLWTPPPLPRLLPPKSRASLFSSSA